MLRNTLNPKPHPTPAMQESMKPAELSGSDEELTDAESTVLEAENKGKVGGRGPVLTSFLEVFGLIFVAEWGDRCGQGWLPGWMGGSVGWWRERGRWGIAGIGR